MTQPAQKAGGAFTLTRHLDAPRERVWRAWTKEAELKRWWGPKDTEVEHCELTLRPGGGLLYALRMPDGRTLWGRWVLHEIEAPRRLLLSISFSDPAGGVTRNPWNAEWPLATLTEVLLEEEDGGTRLTLTITAPDASEAERRAFEAGFDSMRGGWGGTLDRLGSQLQVTAPAPMPPLIPYLTVADAEAAIAFYGTVFGAVERMRLPTQDGRRIMHADLALNGGSLFLNDACPEQGGPPAPVRASDTPVAVVLSLPQPTEVDATHARAIAAGAASVAEPHDVFWGARFAMLTDPFGHRWMLNAPLTRN